MKNMFRMSIGACIWGIGSTFTHAASAQNFAGSPQTIYASSIPQVSPNPCPDPGNIGSSNNMLEAGYGQIAILLNGCWGGTVYQYWWNGIEFSNNNSTGSLINVSLFQYVANINQSSGVNVVGQPFNNPTQAGDLFYNGSGITAEAGSSLTGWGFLPGNSGMWTATNPIDFGAGGSSEAPPNSNYATYYGGLSFVTGLYPNWGGFTNVTRFLSSIGSDQTQNYSLVQIPAVYLRADFDTFYIYNVITALNDPSYSPAPLSHGQDYPPAGVSADAGQINTPGCYGIDGGAGPFSQYNNFNWWGQPATGQNIDNSFSGTCGVVIAADAHPDYNSGYALGVYACTPNRGGSVTRFQISDQSCDWTNSDPSSFNAVAIYPSYDTGDGQNGAGPLAQGTTNFYTYIITGASVAQVESTAVQLYQAGYY